MNPHYISLFLAYTTAAVCWFLFNTFIVKDLWNKTINFTPKKPYLEFIFALITVVIILAIGQLYSNDLLIPNNSSNNFVDGLNQFLIFCPTLGLILLRKQSLETVWLPKNNIPLRLLIGLSLAFIALVVYWLSRKNALPFSDILSNIFHLKNFSHLVQVFMEDITIALIFARLAKWIGFKWSIGLVAFLFAVGHIPSMINNGYSIEEMSSLIFDTGIGVVILTAVSKSKDVWWFFIIHFVLDMTQYYGSI